MGTVERPIRRPSRAWVAVACLAPVPLVAALVLDSGSTALLVAVVVSGLILAVAAFVWAVQRARRQRLDYEERLAAWSAERAVQQERLRIARDLHDLSSHGLGVITVRAAATGYLDGPGADAERRRAMLDIERVGRATTVELRRMLGLLRGDGPAPAPLRPADGFAALPGIVEGAERDGLVVRARFKGIDDGGGVDQGLQLAVCAVVREALTNVVRHAGPTTVRLEVVRRETAVDVLVEDDGPNPGWTPEPGAGHGLTGLRERVGAHGGEIEAAPAGNGFGVRARFPIGAGA